MNLRDYQIPAVEALARTHRGILKAPAGSGKTIMGAAALNDATSLANNTIAQRFYDENRDLFAGIAESSESGAVSGAILGMISAAVGGVKIARLKQKYNIPKDWSGNIEDLAQADAQIASLHTRPTAKDLVKQRAELMSQLTNAPGDQIKTLEAKIGMVNYAIKSDPLNVPSESRADLASALLKVSQGVKFEDLSETEKATLGKAKTSSGVPFIEDHNGNTVITDTAKEWLSGTAPHAADLIGLTGQATKESIDANLNFTTQNEDTQTSQQPGTTADPKGENAPPSEGDSKKTPDTAAAPVAGADPAPLGDDDPIVERKSRAGAMWGGAQEGDIFTASNSLGESYTIAIKKDGDGSRYGEILSPRGDLVDNIQIDKDPASHTKGNGLLFGQEMVRTEKSEPPAPGNQAGSGSATKRQEPETPKAPLTPSSKRARILSKALQNQGVDAVVADHYAALKDGEYPPETTTDQARGNILNDFEADGGKLPKRQGTHNDSAAYWELNGYSPEESAQNAENGRMANEKAVNDAHEQNQKILGLRPESESKSEPAKDSGDLPEMPQARPLTLLENKQAIILSRRLRNEAGVDPGNAMAFARQYVRDGGPPSEVVDAFNDSGGSEKQDQITLPIHVAEQLHGQNVKALLHQIDASKLKVGRRKLTPIQRKNVLRAIRRLAPAIARWNDAFSKITFRDGSRESGGAELTGDNGLQISLGDILDPGYANLDVLINNPERAESLLSEEAIHAIGKKILSNRSIANGKTREEILQSFSDDSSRALNVSPDPGPSDHADAEASDIFNSLPKDLQGHVEGIYSENPRGVPAWKLGHEFLRMLAQRDIAIDKSGRIIADGKVLTEQTLGKKIVDQIREHLSKLLSYFSKLSENLKAGGAKDADISRVEEVRSQIRESIKTLRTHVDESQLASYEREYGIRTDRGRQDIEVNAGVQGAEREGPGLPQRLGDNGRPRDGIAGGTPAQGGGGNLPRGGIQGTGAKGPSEELSGRLSQLEAEKAEREAAEERAKDRRNLATQKKAENTADKEKVLAKVPEDAKGQAEELLKKVQTGKPTYVLGANRERIPAVMVALPPGVVETSHAGEDFHKNPNYGGENTRSYHNDETEQNKVRQMALAGALDEDSIVTDSKSAADGAPQIVMTIFHDADGKLQVKLQTAGGNGREQGINLSPQEDQDRLSQAWKDNAGHHGLEGIHDGWRGYRFLGVYDLRDEAQNRAYLQLVDKLNPNQGVVQDTASRADIDAALKIPAERLVNLPLTMSAEQARTELLGLVKDSEKLGLDRNLMAGLVKNPTQAQFYMQRLLLASAFRSKTLGEFFTASQLSSGHATVTGLIKSATSAALHLREAGHGNTAEAIGRMLENVVEYVKNGDRIGQAIRRASEQTEMGKDGDAINAIASALQKKIEYYPQNKKGIKPVNSEETVSGFEDLMRDITTSIKKHSDEPDMFGGARSMGDTLQAGIDSHFRKNTLTEAESLQSRRAENPIARMRQLGRKRQEEGLNRYETDELTSLEKRAGQHFMGFFDEARKTPDFSLESQGEAGESDQRENEETFSLENPRVQAYLDLSNVPKEKRELAGEAFSQVAKASIVPYEGRDVSTPSGVDGDKLRQAREEQAAAYRGLLKGDAEAVKSAIENGVPLSKLIEAYATGEATPFSIHGAIINSPADLAAHNLAHRTPFFESLKVAILDNSNQVIHSELVSIGSLNESIAHPREIMRAVERGIQKGSDLGRKIQGWMLMHNHPSGDPSPSEADRRLTRRLDEVAKMMESPLLDHVITNGETYFSFNQAGLHGEDVKRDPRLEPKLQTIPKPEDLKAGTMADWEATPASEAVRVDRADVVRNIRATLQTADPGMIHVLNLNTRHGLISVDRHPLDVSPGEILKQSSKHGTYAIALSFPETTPEGAAVDTQGATAAWRPFVRKMTEAGTLYQLPLVDAVTKEFSWRESGLLEEPGNYGSGKSAKEEGEKTYLQAARPEGQQSRGAKARPVPKASPVDQLSLLSRRAEGSPSKMAAEELNRALPEDRSPIKISNPQHLAEEISKVAKGDFKRNRDIYLGYTPASLRKLGAPDVWMNVSSSVIDKAIKKHELAQNEIYNALSSMEDPVLIVRNYSPDGRGHIVMFPGLVSSEREPIAVSVQFNKRQQRFVVNDISTIHGVEDFKSVFPKMEILYGHPKKAEGWIRELVDRDAPGSDVSGVMVQPSSENLFPKADLVNPDPGLLLSRRAESSPSKKVAEELKGKINPAKELEDDLPNPDEIKAIDMEHPAPLIRSASSIGEARRVALKEIVGRELDNDDTNMKASVSGNALGKMTNDKAIKKSSDIESHLFAVANLDHLFKNAKLLETHPDYEESPNIANIHRLGAVILKEGEPIGVKITVKELNHPRENRIYSVQSIETEKPSGLLAEDGGPFLSPAPSVPLDGFHQKMQQMMADVKRREPALLSRRASKSAGQPDLFDDQLDLFIHAKKEAGAYEKALESEGIIDPHAKQEAAIQDLGLTAPEALKLFPSEEASVPTTNSSQISSKLVDAAPSPSPKQEAKKGITDFGEKIGGARKDTSIKTGATGLTKPADERPAWARRYDIAQIAKSMDASEEGKWQISDNKQKDWRGQPKDIGRPFNTKEEAEAAIPLLAVSRNHDVRMERVNPLTPEERAANEAARKAAANQLSDIATKVEALKEEHGALLQKAMMSDMYQKAFDKGDIAQDVYDKIKENGGILTLEEQAKAQEVQGQIDQIKNSLGSGLSSKEDAEHKYTIWRKVSDQKRVQVVEQEFPTREDALRYMAEHAQEIIETKTSHREELFATPENAVRTGAPRREGPADAQLFQDAFGFRGVEFGNWMRQEGEKGNERQEVLDHAYDGLHDLAETLGIPAKAISLNGDLALAFGARGQGLQGAKAHYERTYAAINLTKMSGAGSLAHEWYHAFDHYMARLDGKAKGEMVRNEDGNLVFPATSREGDYSSHGFGYKSQVRPEVRAAYEGLMKVIKYRAVQFQEDSAKAEQFVKSTRDSLTQEIKSLRDSLSRQLDATYYKRNNKPATEAQLAKFDELTLPMINGENLETEHRTVEGKSKWGNYRWTNDSLESLNSLYKEVRGRAGFQKEGGGVLNNLAAYMKRYRERIAMLDSAAKQETKTRTVPSNYAMDAKKIDQGSATDYWTTPHELAARAFSAYVEDRISDAGNKSEFLSYGADNSLPEYRMWNLRPFPEGEERTAINGAFDQLFQTLKAEPTDRGIALLSRRAEGSDFSAGDESALTSEKDPNKLFTFHEVADPNQRELFQRLEGAVNRNAGLKEGTAGGVRVRQVAISGIRSDSGANARRFISAFERLTGTKVWFVDTNQTNLSFKASRLRGDNKNIFVHARSERPLDAMAWHEWAHVLEEANPNLYAELKDAVKKYSADWSKAVGEINPDIYKTEQSRESEVVNNTLGDAFMDPVFWDGIKRHHDGTLFARAYEAAQKWFSSILDKARTSWGTESQSTDVRAMRDEMAEIISRAFPNDANEKGNFKLGKRNPDAGGMPIIDASADPIPVESDQLQLDFDQAREDGAKSPAQRLRESQDIINSIAAKFSDMPNYDVDDARQKARIAIAKAAKAYDPERGVPFNTFATFAAKNALRDLYRVESRYADRFQTTLDESIRNDFEGNEVTRKDQITDATTPLASDQAAKNESQLLLNDSISELPDTIFPPA